MATKSARVAAGSKNTKRPGAEGWLLLVYKVPSEPSRVRVAVWRELKRLGALYLQQAVCILPNRPETAEGLAKVRERIEALEGTSYFFVLPAGDKAQDGGLVDGFRELAAKEYAEIVEECETKFIKEI